MTAPIGLSPFLSGATAFVDRALPARPPAPDSADLSALPLERRKRQTLVRLMAGLSLASPFRALGPDIGPKSAQEQAREIFADALLRSQTVKELVAGGPVTTPGAMAVIAAQRQESATALNEAVGRAVDLRT